MELGEEPAITDFNSETSITPDAAFYKVVKPHKGMLFELGTAQIEELINLTGIVNLMSQQLTALKLSSHVVANSYSSCSRSSVASELRHSDGLELAWTLTPRFQSVAICRLLWFSYRLSSLAMNKSVAI
nr:unnamed protein product [Brassica oleracea]